MRPRQAARIAAAYFPTPAVWVLSLATVLTACVAQSAREDAEREPTGAGEAIDDMSPQTLAEGQRIFRFETFGDEQFWTDTARMHEVVQQSVSPATALSVGLKVDADAIPADCRSGHQGRQSRSRRAPPRP